MLKNERYNTEIEPLDWRYSAAIVGLYKYLQYHGEEGIDFEVTDDVLRFNRSDLTEEKYLEFAEHYYGEAFHHKKLENILSKSDFSKEQKDSVNELLEANSILKKVFSKLKFDEANKEVILKMLEENRNLLIKETFRNKSNMYPNFANVGHFFEEGKKCCRLQGYYVAGKKTKSISYNFDVNTYVSKDDLVFDFIPFAFTGEGESFFINDSYSVKNLINTNKTFVEKFKEGTKNQKKDARKTLFKSIQEMADFLDYDVEVILKNIGKSYFETMFIRKESIDVLRAIKVYEPFCFSFKVTDNYYINIQKEVTNCILNLIRTDELIEMFLKQKSWSQCLINILIDINRLVCGGGEYMRRKIYQAKTCAENIVNKIPDNKCASYRQKLLSSVIFKDYDRCCEILLQLSNYSGIPFDFVYELFEDFEENKDIVYTFINALVKKKSEGTKEKKDKGEI